MYTVSLKESEFAFLKNATHRKPWNFLPATETSEIIAAQLTYLDFHGWLTEHLQTAPRDADAKDLTSIPVGLYGDVLEGFYRTDVLLYAAVCEAALHCVLSNAHKEGYPQVALAECFTVEKVKYRDAGKGRLTHSNIPNQDLRLCFRYTEVEKKDKVDFQDTIKAAKKLNILDAALFERLESLRRQRNTIHLAKHAEHRGNNNSKLGKVDVEEAKTITEELRVALDKFHSEIVNFACI